MLNSPWWPLLQFLFLHVFTNWWSDGAAAVGTLVPLQDQSSTQSSLSGDFWRAFYVLHSPPISYKGRIGHSPGGVAFLSVDSLILKVLLLAWLWLPHVCSRTTVSRNKAIMLMLSQDLCASKDLNMDVPSSLHIIRLKALKWNHNFALYVRLYSGNWLVTLYYSAQLVNTLTCPSVWFCSWNQE